MATITATPNPVLIDNTATPPETSATSRIRYIKSASEELWERQPGAGWTQINVHVRTGRGDAEFSGDFDVDLGPGQTYTVGIFGFGHGPTSTDPMLRDSVTVFGLFKKPARRALVIDDSGAVGGTWLNHGVKTNAPTRIVMAAASRRRPRTDADGVPQLVEPDAQLSPSANPTNTHFFELKPLVPGHHYFLTIMVADGAGQWEVLEREVETLKRQITVKFPVLHIYNDGDPNSVGEGEFWIRVSAGNEGRPGNTLKEFHIPEMNIDDWSKTDRPYSMPFVYVESEPQTIAPGRTYVWVSSWAIEYDGLAADEYAGTPLGRGVRLPLPTGQGENVPSATLKMNCPPISDDDFHYGVDVTYSVQYLPG